ncbi:MAG: hypothetical protein OQL19_00415 [Gammaproteobacteria bacterium]|nr:hypothetical protein [Gammaproteobacteria bacterium]
MKKFALPIFFILSMIGIIKFYFHIQAQEQIQLMITQAAPFVQIKYQDLDLELNGDIVLQELVAYDLRGRPIIQIKELVVHDFQQTNGYLSSIDLDVKDLLVNMKPTKKPGKFGLYELGYRQVNANIHFAYHFSDFSNTLNLQLGVLLDGIADAQFELELANVDPEQWRYYMQNSDSLLLIRTELNAQNFSLAEKIVAYLAKRKNQTVEDVYQQLESKLNFYKQQASEGDKQWREELAKKWEMFVKNPDRIRLRAHIDEGVSLRKLRSGGISRLPELLSLSIDLPGTE